MKIEAFSHKQKKVMTWWMPESPMSDKDLIVCEGAIRSGKTLVTVLSFINWSQTRFSGEAFIIAGVSVGAVKRNLLEPLFEALKMMDIPYNWKVSEKKLTVGDNIYYVFGANNAYSQDAIQGLTAAGLLIDEVPLIPRSFVEQAMGRCSVNGAKYWFTLNPASPFHWFKEEVLNRLDERNGFSMKFTMEDNPSLNEHTMERYKRMFTGLFYKRYILGEWVVAEGAVYDMFDIKTHVIDCPQNPDFYDKRIVAIDYATSSVMTFGLYGIKDDVVYLVKSYYWDATKQKRQKTDAEYARDLKHFIDGWKVSTIYVDPSASSFQATLRYANFQMVRNAVNDVVNGIRMVATKLQERKFFIDKSCKDDIQEMTTYAWDSKAQELGDDKPIKKNDHACDRTRYAIHTYFTKPAGKAIPKPRGF